MKHWLRGLGLAAVPCLGLAQNGDEPPPGLKAGQILGARASGPHYKVADQVDTSGYFFGFDVQSDFGTMDAEGRSLLEQRLQEVEALAKLQDVSKSEVFAKAAGGAVINVGKGVVNVAKDPVGTAKGIGGGIKRFGVNLGRKGKRAAADAEDAVVKTDAEKAKEAEAAASGAPQKSTTDKAAEASGGAAKSVFGVNAASRRWAQKVQVDPYTSNQVLRQALEEFGKIDAAGGIAAKIVVPIPAIASTTASVSGLVWGKDPEELRKINEKRAEELGVDKNVASAFFRNGAFTPTYQTRLIAALSAVKPKGGGDYVDAAHDADDEREVRFFVEGAEMLQALHAKTPVSELLTDSRAMVARVDKRAVVLLPVDWVRWTAAFEKAAAEVAERSKSELAAGSLELQVRGGVSERARKELEARGWKVGAAVGLGRR